MARKPSNKPVEIRYRIGANVRRLRTQLGWSQGQLAAAIGVNISRVSNLELGRRDPNLATLLKFAEALNVPLNELLM